MPVEERKKLFDAILDQLYPDIFDLFVRKVSSNSYRVIDIKRFIEAHVR